MLRRRTFDDDVVLVSVEVIGLTGFERQSLASGVGGDLVFRRDLSRLRAVRPVDIELRAGNRSSVRADLRNAQVALANQADIVRQVVHAGFEVELLARKAIDAKVAVVTAGKTAVHSGHAATLILQGDAVAVRLIRQGRIQPVGHGRQALEFCIVDVAVRIIRVHVVLRLGGRKARELVVVSLNGRVAIRRAGIRAVILGKGEVHPIDGQNDVFRLLALAVGVLIQPHPAAERDGFGRYGHLGDGGSQRARLARVDGVSVVDGHIVVGRIFGNLFRLGRAAGVGHLHGAVGRDVGDVYQRGLRICDALRPIA